ncbi:MAG: DUF881 domain-containing protein [Armatimonadota bacterium]|nr:DUF881 domain-containing protein [Armatimonadota bacterium]
MRKAGSDGPADPGASRRTMRWQAAMAVPLALIGFLAVTQIRTEWQIRRTLRIPSTRLEELAYTLREQERRRSALEAQVAELRGRLVDYQRAAAEGRTAVTRLHRELQDLRTLAGLTALEGPGVIVVLNDSTRIPQPGEDPNKTILHYSDLAAVVSELWAAGAEAVAINGERVVSSTGINCVGTTILCNTKRMAPPYAITAIGDRAQLEEYLRRSGGALDQLASFDFSVALTTHPRVVVPPYRGTFTFEYAGVSERE